MKFQLKKKKTSEACCLITPYNFRNTSPNSIPNLVPYWTENNILAWVDSIQSGINLQYIPTIIIVTTRVPPPLGKYSAGGGGWVSIGGRPDMGGVVDPAEMLLPRQPVPINDHTVGTGWHQRTARGTIQDTHPIGGSYTTFGPSGGN